MGSWEVGRIGKTEIIMADMGLKAGVSEKSSHSNLPQLSLSFHKEGAALKENSPSDKQFQNPFRSAQEYTQKNARTVLFS